MIVHTRQRRAPTNTDTPRATETHAPGNTDTLTSEYQTLLIFDIGAHA
jgi:hypothetical protein